MIATPGTQHPLGQLTGLFLVDAQTGLPLTRRTERIVGLASYAACTLRCEKRDALENACALLR